MWPFSAMFTIEPSGRRSVENYEKLMKLPILRDIWSKRYLTGKIIKAEWCKMLDSSPLDTILHIFASTLLGKGYFLSWIGQKRAKMASFRRFGLWYIWIVYSAYSHLWSLLVMHNLLRLSPEKVFCTEAVKPVKWQPHEVGKSQKKKRWVFLQIRVKNYFLAPTHYVFCKI